MGRFLFCISVNYLHLDLTLITPAEVAHNSVLSTYKKNHIYHWFRVMLRLCQKFTFLLGRNLIGWEQRVALCIKP